MFPELRLLRVTVRLADVSDMIAMNVARYKISLLLCAFIVSLVKQDLCVCVHD